MKARTAFSSVLKCFSRNPEDDQRLTVRDGLRVSKLLEIESFFSSAVSYGRTIPLWIMFVDGLALEK